MRSRTLVALLASLPFTAVQMPAQSAFGGTARAEVRAMVRLTMPEILVLLPPAAPVATARGALYTEYRIVYRLAANARWALTASALPQGVTLLSETGEWQPAAGSVAEHGVATNPVEITVRVRVAPGASRTWAQDLRLELRGAER